jgi:hypothetical protein
MWCCGKGGKGKDMCKRYNAAFCGRVLYWGCVKSFFTALRAELYFDRRVIFTISLREIVKMTRLSEEYSAAVGGKNLFTQPQMIVWREAPKLLRGRSYICCGVRFRSSNFFNALSNSSGN